MRRLLRYVVPQLVTIVIALSIVGALILTLDSKSTSVIEAQPKATPTPIAFSVTDISPASGSTSVDSGSLISLQTSLAIGKWMNPILNPPLMGNWRLVQNQLLVFFPAFPGIPGSTETIEISGPSNPIYSITHQLLPSLSISFSYFALIPNVGNT